MFKTIIRSEFRIFHSLYSGNPSRLATFRSMVAAICLKQPAGRLFLFVCMFLLVAVLKTLFLAFRDFLYNKLSRAMKGRISQDA